VIDAITVMSKLLYIRLYTVEQRVLNDLWMTRHSRLRRILLLPHFLPPLPSFQIFQTFAEIFVNQGASPLSTTPVVNFASGTAGVIDTVANNENNIRLLTP
jgi:hypothetical protein